jgi:hypothetical protein
MSKNKSKATSPSIPPDRRFVMRVLALPRAVRILLAALPAIALVALLQPMVDLIYINLFFNESTVVIPAWILAAFGLAMYFAGWVFLVGLPGDDMTQKRGAMLFIALSLIIVAMLMVYYALQIINNVGAFAG